MLEWSSEHDGVMRDCSHALAGAVIRYAASEGHASPASSDDLDATVRCAMWIPSSQLVHFRPGKP